MDKAKLQELLDSMTLQEKVGQMFQGSAPMFGTVGAVTGNVGMEWVTPEIVYTMGSVLNDFSIERMKKLQNHRAQSHHAEGIEIVIVPVLREPCEQRIPLLRLKGDDVGISPAREQLLNDRAVRQIGKQRGIDEQIITLISAPFRIDAHVPLIGGDQNAVAVARSEEAVLDHERPAAVKVDDQLIEILRVGSASRILEHAIIVAVEHLPSDGDAVYKIDGDAVELLLIHPEHVL